MSKVCQYERFRFSYFKSDFLAAALPDHLLCTIQLNKFIFYYYLNNYVYLVLLPNIAK